MKKSQTSKDKYTSYNNTSTKIFPPRKEEILFESIRIIHYILTLYKKYMESP